MTRDKDRDYRTVADVLVMYTVLMERYGGESGIRDPISQHQKEFPFFALLQ